MRETFYMLYLDGGGAPTVCHGTKEAAKAEAERLARAHSGRRVYVMQAVASVIKSDVAWESAPGLASDDEIPF